jgi:hypothetical protein
MLSFPPGGNCLMSTTRRVFSDVFKREAVDRVISSGLPVGKVATDLRLNETVRRR